MSCEDNFFETLKINMIDFGFATKYVDEETHEHVEKKLLKYTLGVIWNLQA